MLWEKGYDNELDGDQLIYTDGKEPQQVKLYWDKSDIAKPNEIIRLWEIIQNKDGFSPLQKITSISKPYGIRKDVFVNYKKYGLAEFNDKQVDKSDIKVYGSFGETRFIPIDYALPKRTIAFNKYKVLVGSAWGNMSESAGLGGAYANIIIAKPNEICTETYQESGCFDTIDMAKKHAKYLLTKFARALLYVFKISQMSTNAWGAVPIQDYSETWWDKSIAEIDKELIKKYSIPDDIAEFIDKNIQAKDESNIINFNDCD